MENPRFYLFLPLSFLKSISRLGRNTVEFLQAVAFFNTLKIDVYFEVENPHCYDKTAVKMLTIYASLYQHESESKSFATCWGIKRGLKAALLKCSTVPATAINKTKTVCSKLTPSRPLLF
ncbi:MAG: recombinase family protein [Clostridiales bacterium]|nr:recombinase family protein [Candidatus Equinaster intestinalis]